MPPETANNGAGADALALNNFKGDYAEYNVLGGAASLVASGLGLWKPEKLYKVLGPHRESYHGGKPVVWTPGKWMPAVRGPLVPCQRGYHLCRRPTFFQPPRKRRR